MLGLGMVGVVRRPNKAISGKMTAVRPSHSVSVVFDNTSTVQRSSFSQKREKGPSPKSSR